MRKLNFSEIGYALIIFTAFTLIAHFANAQQQPTIGKTIKGCTAVGGYKGGDFTVRYEKTVAVAITPEGSDYWVFYPDDLERHRRTDGSLIALLLPTKRFIEDGKPKKILFTEHKMKICLCPKFFWGPGDPGVSADH
jgi:hypothetical protein